MKITIMSLFRDSEESLGEYTAICSRFEQDYPDIDFSYAFYENDSEDATPTMLDLFLRLRDGFVLSEKLGMPKFGSTTQHERMTLMTYYRNALLEEARPLDSDYTIMWDSDIVDIHTDILRRYLYNFIEHEDMVMCTPNIVQNVPCLLCGKDSYYDSWALKDLYGKQGLTWCCNPFTDRIHAFAFKSGNLVPVESAFGGFAMVKTKVLNESTTGWWTDGACEHWGLCAHLRRSGTIMVDPKIVIKTNISDKVKESIVYPNYELARTQQKDKLNADFCLPE